MQFAFIGLCAVSVFAVILTPFYIKHEDWHYLIAVWFLVGLTGGSTLLLRSRLWLSLRTLRLLELTAFGLLVAYMTQDLCYTLFRLRFAAVFAYWVRISSRFTFGRSGFRRVKSSGSTICSSG
jgi:hypothetical protein